MNPVGAFLRPAKRQRVEAYQKGAVIKVRVQNFMTYAEAEIVPGPRLNLVLGPNGTGKSSLVCAICVGLAGGTRLLGRADDVSSFVRRGTQKGWVEITLCSGNAARPSVIKRTIYANNNTSDWQLDGRESTMRDIKEVVEKLHVQLDNLCQFLPQDKVVEFARMKPVQLLHATEQAIENGELHEQHQALMEERSKLQHHESAAAAMEGSLGRLREEQARNERTVAQMRKRKKLLAEVEDMKKKLPWLEYQAAKDDYDLEKQQFEVVQQQLRGREEEQKRQEGPLKEKRRLAERLERQRRAAADASRALEKKIAGDSSAGNGLEAQLQDTLDSIEDKQKEIDGLAEQSRQRQAKLQRLEALVQGIQQELDSLPGDSVPQIQEDRKRLLAEQNDINVQASSLREQLEEVRGEQHTAEAEKQKCQRILQQLDDAKLQRLRVLEERNKGMIEAWRWLQNPQTRSMFRGRVYGPIAAEVDCPNPKHAAYLEQHVSAINWTFFVTEHREDQDLLRRELQQRFRFTPNISNFGGNADEPIQHPNGEASHYARYHITHTLDQVFMAPSLVKHVLCEESGINRSFVGAEQTQAIVEQMLAETREITSLWVPDANYRRQFSLYDANAQSTMVCETRPARLLTKAAPGQGGQEREEAEACIKQSYKDLRVLEDKYNALARQAGGVEKKLQDVKRQLEQINKKVADNAARRRQMTIKLNASKRDLDRTSKDPDPLTKEPALQRQMQALRKKAFVLALELAQATLQLGASLPKYIALELGWKEAKEQEEAYARAIRETARDLERLQGVVKQYEARVKDLQSAARHKKQQAESVAPLTEELQQKFADMPDSIQGLQREIDQKFAEAEGICISNPAALEEYNRRCEEIRRQEGELAQLKEKVELSRQKIEEVKGAWLPRLQRVVAQINATFSTSFAQVGCAGEVVLREAEGEDFSNYAVEIRVKFRDCEDLRTLDANHQSGGERSVSTMLYLISLQGVTITPFRVVDEINQGMDPINERKIFIQLVKAACGAGTPQCFLLTPKLLPDLPFTRDVRVLQIMNGPYIRDVAANFSMEKLLGSQRMSQLNASQPA